MIQYNKVPIENCAIPAGVHVSVLLATILIIECFIVALARHNGRQPVNNLPFADAPCKTSSAQAPWITGEALRLRYLVLILRADSVFSRLQARHPLVFYAEP